MEMVDKIRIGVSACLCGQPVRFDGNHKHDRYLTDTLGEYLDFVPVCPKVESGFSIPRETLRLVGDPQNPRLVTSRTNIDHTDHMLGWAEQRVRELEAENLCGFIFKSDSPISGFLRVKVYNPKGMAEKHHCFGVVPPLKFSAYDSQAIFGQAVGRPVEKNPCRHTPDKWEF
jgi:uncharacterized protein YbbK (DUF523 family)